MILRQYSILPLQSRQMLSSYDRNFRYLSTQTPFMS
jgi:hypothetical protein